MPNLSQRPTLRATLACSLALLGGCREASSSSNEGEQAPAPTPAAIVPSTAGTSGCNGPAEVFTPPQVPVAEPAFITVNVGPASQITAPATGERVYLTSGDARVYEIGFPAGGGQRTETIVVGINTVANLLAAAGVTAPPVLSGIAVLDDDSLVVMEHTANVLLRVDRNVPDTVSVLAGLPSVVGGLADGPATGGPGLCRFNFHGPAQVVPTGDVPQRLFIGDTGNDRIRLLVAVDALGFPAELEDGSVVTLAGTGAGVSIDGPLDQAAFDNPSGLVVDCDDGLIVAEQGALLGGQGGGNRLRRLDFLEVPGSTDLDGTASTIVGDGTPSTTEGDLDTATVAAPVSPLTTADGEIYWIDSDTGVLRRLAADLADCPLEVDCATAVSSTVFTPGGSFSLTRTAGGTLYVLEGSAGVLWRVSP